MNMHDPIQEIMEKFDFQLVHRYMASVDWRWSTSSTDSVPSVEELKDRAYHLLCQATKSTIPTRISTGGLVALKHQWGELELYFAIEDASSYVGTPNQGFHERPV